jgi:DNA adenine methylase
VNQPIKWFGGKKYLASKIVELMPKRDGTRPWHLYREPYAGGLSVLLHLDPEGLSEAVNDIHKDLTNFWRVLRYDFLQFKAIVGDIPFSEAEWLAARDHLNSTPAEYTDHWRTNPINRAAMFFVYARQSRQGLMQHFATPTRRLRRGMNENVSAWLSAVDGLAEVHQRLMRVEIRCMDALKFILDYDDPEAVFYLDPPYLAETRTSKDVYEFEMDDTAHRRLLLTLNQLQGRFLLSGYRSKLYDQWAKENGYRRIDIKIDNKAGAGKTKQPRTECVWMNYEAA